FYGDWIEQQIVPLVRRSRIRDHKQIFNRYVLPRFGKVDLSQIKAGDLQKWQAQLIESGLKVKTVRNVIDSSFRAMYKAARGKNPVLESKDPFADLTWPKAKLLPPDPLSRDDKARILACFAESEPWYYPFMKFQFDTGCRPSETIAISWA